CRSYHIWRITPVELSIPLTCTDEDKTSSTHRFPFIRALAPLSMLQPTTNQAEVAIPQNRTFALSVTAETIIDYIVATYGRDKLPQLIGALGEYTTLDTLIPSVFGVSQASFEASWLAYLAQHYQ